jgi:hypothetical protein
MAHDLVTGIPEAEPIPDIFDASDPRSLVNIVWKDFRDVLKRTVNAYPELFTLSEARLQQKAKPEPQHRMMRMRFWQEYDIAQQANRTMRASDVTRGICIPEYWSRNVNTNPELLAYIITPPPRYITRMETMLDLALDNLLEILELPVKNEKTGFIDSKLIANKVKVFELLDLRVKGAIMQKVAIHQRIDQHTQITEGTSLEKMDLNDLQAIESSIQQVKKQIERTQNRQAIQIENKKPAEEVFEEPELNGD